MNRFSTIAKKVVSENRFYRIQKSVLATLRSIKDIPLEILKARAVKYFKRLPTGNAKRPWRYFYNQAQYDKYVKVKNAVKQTAKKDEPSQKENIPKNSESITEKANEEKPKQESNPKNFSDPGFYKEKYREYFSLQDIDLPNFKENMEALQALVKDLPIVNLDSPGNDKLKNKFKKNENNNFHSENTLLLANASGSQEAIALAKQILNAHKKQGHLPEDAKRVRSLLDNKLLGFADVPKDYLPKILSEKPVEAKELNKNKEQSIEDQITEIQTKIQELRANEKPEIKAMDEEAWYNAKATLTTELKALMRKKDAARGFRELNQLEKHVFSQVHGVNPPEKIPVLPTGKQDSIWLRNYIDEQKNSGSEKILKEAVDSNAKSKAMEGIKNAKKDGPIEKDDTFTNPKTGKVTKYGFAYPSSAIANQLGVHSGIHYYAEGTVNKKGVFIEDRIFSSTNLANAKEKAKQLAEKE